MKRSTFILSLLCLVPMLALIAGASHLKSSENHLADESTITIQYLEIVTPDIDETCKALAAMHGVEFGDPIPEFGNARTADLADGGRIGVRGPMRASESPVVRPYVKTKDIEAAVKVAKDNGAVIAFPPMAMPGDQGTFAIYILGGIEHGLWEVKE